MKEPWLEYITKFGNLESIEVAFIKLRKSLKDAGFTEEDTKSISSGPQEVFMLRDNLIDKILDTKKELMKYGIWNDETKSNFDTYISRKLSKLEKKYTLKDVN